MDRRDDSDTDRFSEAVAAANLPTLLMVLVQLTGERRWLEPPYRPHRHGGMGDNDDGGLPEQLQTEVREAALEAILAWRAGRPVAIAEPPGELLVEMLTCAMDEPVPPEYGQFIAAQLATGLPDVPPIEAPDGFNVLIIGSGVSGMCLAVSLELAGIPFTIVEKNERVGGRTPDGTTETLHAHVLVSATGIFNPLKYPAIEGLDSFAGPTFHTARWPQDVDLEGKKVAIVGTGASSMQTAPEIQPVVERLTIFQRSPQWAAPFDQFRKEVPEPVRFLLREVPAYRAWYRVRLGGTFKDRIHGALQKDPDWPHPERSL